MGVETMCRPATLCFDTNPSAGFSPSDSRKLSPESFLSFLTMQINSLEPDIVGTFEPQRSWGRRGSKLRFRRSQYFDPRTET